MIIQDIILCAVILLFLLVFVLYALYYRVVETQKHNMESLKQYLEETLKRGEDNGGNEQKEA